MEQLEHNLGPGPFHEAAGDDVRVDGALPVSLYAFFLPQFHAIPENDAWWGKGFTEWTNVTKALPRFRGHYQPHLPADLGFYDLRVADTLRAQAELAKRYGVAGFCFYYYWFGGKRLLDQPIKALLAAPDIDLPFFVSWANENWTRRWDGLEKQLLLEQRYSAEDDIALADAFLELTRDRRYVRIDGRPLLMLYQPRLLPDAGATTRRWRDRFLSRGEADPYILTVHREGEPPATTNGMDGSFEFPPAGFGSQERRREHLHRLFDLEFRGTLFSYDELVESMQATPNAPHPVFKGVCPGWDNEARRTKAGCVYQGSTPRKYGAWLARACQTTIATQPADRRMLFVNAWNEWAEGAHLEPDRHYGHAYLRETARALTAARQSETLAAFIADRSADLARSTPPAWTARMERVRRFVERAQRKARRMAPQLGI
nr:glycoside hydrolase family 99-like domain-containing protein [Schlegelella koreensis]